MDKAGFFESRVNLLQFYPEGDPRREAILDRLTDEAGVTPDELQAKKEEVQDVPPQGMGIPSSMGIPSVPGVEEVLTQ